MRGTSFLSVLFTMLIVLLLAGVVAFIMYFTNNFSTDLTTFYVQYSSQELRRDTGGMRFERGVYYTFKVNYPLGFPSNETGERYHVSVEVGEAGKDIEYRVDSRLTSLYPRSPDLSESFGIVRDTNSFMFYIPEETTLESILKKAYEGKEVTEIPQVDFTEKDYFCLTVKSYDETKVIRIGFGFVSEANPPEEEPIEKYAIEYDTLGNGSVNSVKFDCVPEAAAGETVTFTVSLVDNKYGDYYSLEITRIVLEDIDWVDDEVEIGSGEGTFSFTMPAHTATIMIYLMPKEV